MPLTERQLTERRAHIGSSDVAAILGVNPYASAYDVWLEKTGRYDPRDERQSDAAAAGNRLEPVVLRWASQEGGLGDITRRGTERRLTGTPIKVHVDGLVKIDGSPVEAKTSGIFGPVIGYWGLPGTDQVPKYYIAQCTAHVMATKRDVCYLPVLLGGRGYQMFQVDRHQRLIDVIGEWCESFWQNHVKADTPPADTVGSEEVLKKSWRVEGKRTIIDKALGERWRKTRRLRLSLEKREKRLREQMLSLDPDAEVFDFGDDAKILQFKATQRRQLDQKRLKADYPELVDQYTYVNTSRSLTERKRDDREHTE